MALRTRCLKPPVTGNPYMLSLRAGQNRSWESFDKGMTHGFILEFASQEDLDYYLAEDPVHLEFSRRVGAQGLVEDSVVIDIKDGQLMLGPADMPQKPGTRQGQCHCGKTRFTAVLPLPRSSGATGHILCHCRTCRLLSGAPYTCNQIIAKEDLKIVEGSPSRYTYTGASGKPVDCYFCSHCTSHVYREQAAMPGKVIVRTLLLQDSEGWGVDGEMFREGRLEWAGDLERSLPS
ncbi:hypothetical protein LTR37_001798 [Vermiconidia calcicola]|uniref:Uncharacterized protein n=1 Tax=Vermiconidia calcicola TaxID=1690605 RepID=A0ACC3NUS0_9PEZI|nr:hypothetical protein LTR37_001798 [Vermiconidia calcicola]